MKSAVYTKAGQVGLAEIDRPQIVAADDAIIKIVRTCVCGSDLWSYRNPEMEEGHRNSGHEAIGIVEEVGEQGYYGKTRRLCHCTFHTWVWSV